ncbi:hypothetical protein AVI51_07145 [Piscirickettsia salmonis]|uniref:IcmC protein n=2 Tax=Piscirickettsia salmonis TaxID=1238 RepID=A0A9Q5YKL1_PISSA|nr:hypothetical protein [Piscirickettsia salmonis]ALA25849.1 type IV secretion system protein IcmC [Piscirickettsia salmonis]APS43326.1 hypothetical protein AVI48_02340 [Piscirickettsia salmonis]APS46675.1 hypothetical protein AVI49_02945 [Piscirickettsia salmonis]APS50651.1 hypothetical protein AVI50_07230 [Piscirickettsia salmonis]APS53856.1 hypothetical protein AVI51_07145 [Piscirickettsia salmonis]
MLKKYSVLLVRKIPVIVILQLVITGSCYAVTTDSTFSFSSMSKDWQHTLLHIAIFVEFASAISGVVLVIVGLVKLRQNQANQGQQQNTMVGTSYLFIGALLLAIGSIIVVLSNSVNPVDGGVTKGIQDIMSSASSITTPTTVYDGIVVYLLIPFLQIVNIIGPVIGLITLCVGVHRLRYHTNPQMMSMHRRSPMATGFYFFVGSVLLAPFYLVQALSSSLFQTPELINKYCGGGEEGFLSYFGNLQDMQLLLLSSNGTPYCAQVSPTDVTDNLLKLTYIILFIVGFVSFLRGIFLLTKLGEHMGGAEASVSKVVAHILAGICAVNANVLIDIASSSYNLITGLSA